MSDYQIAMMALAGLPLIWGAVAGLLRRRAAATATDGRPNILGVKLRENLDRDCGYCGTWLRWARICTHCGLHWCVIARLNVAYRHKKPTKREVIAFVRLKDKADG